MLGASALMCGTACDETVDQGQDFSVADVIFDANFFYCRVEPMLFAQGCGTGNGSGESSSTCHNTQTSFRLVEYPPPHVDESCAGGVIPGVSPPAAAQQNYQRAQAKMNRDPDRAALFMRPTGVATHPRVIFDKDSPEAEVIREWATKFSTQ